MSTVTEDGQPVEFVAHYFVHGRERFDGHPSLVDAFDTLFWGFENGALAHVDLRAPDGTVLLDHDALTDLFVAKLDACDEDRDFDLDEALMRTRREIEAAKSTQRD